MSIGIGARTIYRELVYTVMSSTDELLREIETEDVADGPAQSESQTNGNGSRRARIADTVGQVFSPRYFLVSLVLISVGLFLPSFVPFVSALPGVGLIGAFLAAFALGAFSSEQQYLETGVAGAVAVGASIFSKFLFVSMVSNSGIQIAAVGAAVGGIVTVLGYYFGRDFRDGMTREIE